MSAGKWVIPEDPTKQLYNSYEQAVAYAWTFTPPGERRPEPLPWKPPAKPSAEQLLSEESSARSMDLLMGSKTVLEKSIDLGTGTTRLYWEGTCSTGSLFSPRDVAWRQIKRSAMAHGFGIQEDTMSIAVGELSVGDKVSVSAFCDAIPL